MVNFNPMNVSAAVFPMVDGLDSIAPNPAGPGLYTVLYTPTVAGPYDVALTLNGVAVANDLTRSVAVAPAQEYAATTTHNMSQVPYLPITSHHIAPAVTPTLANPSLGVCVCL